MSQSEKQKDEFLILDYQSGNKMALAILVKRWHKKFCTKAFYIVKDADEAKDVAQNSWRTIIGKLETIRDPQKFSGWSMRIVHTKSIDVLRKRQKDLKRVEALKFDSVEEDEPYDEENVLKKKLYSAILELSIDQQEVIKLFYLEELAISRIAKLLEIKVGTVKSRLFHAREKLKLILKNYNYEN